MTYEGLTPHTNQPMQMKNQRNTYKVNFSSNEGKHFKKKVNFLRKRVNLSSESCQLYSGERVNQIRMGKQVLRKKA